MRDFKPHPYQRIMVDFALSHRRCALWAGMGMGKTSATLAVADAALLSGLVKRPLVIAPLRVARGTWPNEGRKWREFNHLLVRPIVGSADERRAALRNPKRADIYTINYDNLVWLIDELAGKWPFDMVVADESTRLKNYRIKQGGKRAQALSEVIDKTRRWINLTGTPAPNGLQDLWGQTWFLDKGFRLGKSYSGFEERWFGFKRAKDAVNAHKTHIQRFAFPHAQPEIQDLLKDICLTLDPRDWFDLTEPITRTVEVELPPEARKNYNQMERLLFTTLQEFGIEAFSAAAKQIKCLQLANGAVYTGSDEQVVKGVSHWVNAHDEKLEALESIIEEAAGAIVMVAYHFKPDLVRLQKRFPGARLISTVKDEDDFRAGRIPIALVHAQSIGHGVDGFQEVCHHIVFFGHWWAREAREQLIERIGPVRQKQAGFDRPTWIYNIVAKDTVDEAVLESHVRKKSVEQALMDYMKERS